MIITMTKDTATRIYCEGCSDMRNTKTGLVSLTYFTTSGVG